MAKKNDALSIPWLIFLILAEIIYCVAIIFVARATGVIWIAILGIVPALVIGFMFLLFNQKIAKKNIEEGEDNEKR